MCDIVSVCPSEQLDYYSNGVNTFSTN
jgi:hypothetical protein